MQPVSGVWGGVNNVVDQFVFGNGAGIRAVSACIGIKGLSCCPKRLFIDILHEPLSSTCYADGQYTRRTTVAWDSQHYLPVSYYGLILFSAGFPCYSFVTPITTTALSLSIVESDDLCVGGAFELELNLILSSYTPATGTSASCADVRAANTVQAI